MQDPRCGIRDAGYEIRDAGSGFGKALSRFWPVGRHDKALEALSVLNDPPAVFRVLLAASYARLDRIDEAQNEVARILELEPGFSITRLGFLPFKDDADRAKLADDLWKAGLPD